jgi:hypothetical protein
MSFIGGDRSIDAFIRCPPPDGDLDDSGLVVADEPLIAQEILMLCEWNCEARSRSIPGHRHRLFNARKRIERRSMMTELVD